GPTRSHRCGDDRVRSPARVRGRGRPRGQVRHGADARLRPPHRTARRRSGPVGGAQRAGEDRRDAALLLAGRAGAPGRAVRSAGAVGKDPSQPSLDERDGARPVVSGEHGVRADGAVHVRLRGRGREVLRGPRGRRDTARVAVQRPGLLCGPGGPAAGCLDLVGSGGGVPASCLGLEGDDGALLRRQPLAATAPRQLRPALRLQGGQHLRELGRRHRGAAEGSGRGGGV
ncbi:MAG: hypothetical protein AVDCRST_MAG17-137, partial [uncultured Solirubrobacterales bacterium]